MCYIYFRTAILAIVLKTVLSQDQSVYQYFQDTEELTGLVAENKEFRLNEKYIRIISGGIHYFRVHPDLWRDRLRKLRAMGANTVETYISWNLHEPEKDHFDFGYETNDFSPFMNIRHFIQLAQEEDLLVILRPGPFICAEWEYGGMPSWLQRDPNMRVRENYQPYLDRVKIYLDAFLEQVVDLQFTRGGSIIAAQIENEYSIMWPRDKEYLEFIRQTFQDNGLDCLYTTADSFFNGDGLEGSLPGLLQTANFGSSPDGIFDRMLEIQPDMPLMGMEYWTGWFTNWFAAFESGSDALQFRDNLETIFNKYNGSVNFYPFHGGTNFGFMAGANSLDDPPYIGTDVTSYNYDATLTEAGDYTLKYNLAAEVIEQYENPKLRKPLRPQESVKVAYPTLSLQKYLTYNDFIDQIPESHKIQMPKPVSMELLPINNDSGQSYGYVIYRKSKTINNGDVYRASWPRDFAELLLDGELIDTGYTNEQPDYLHNDIKEFTLDVTNNGEHVIDLLVENLGRINVGSQPAFVQQKGIAEVHQSKIELNDQEILNVTIIAAEFKGSWVKSLENWRDVTDPEILKGPVIIQSSFNIGGISADTFLDMSKWHKGIVFINEFNIGRYWKVGPQQTLYVPAPLLKAGENNITIFEQFEPAVDILFTDVPILGQQNQSN